MPQNKHKPKPEPGPLGTGARVLVRRPSEPAQTGQIIEDYAELMAYTEERGHAWLRCTGGRSPSTMGVWSSPTPTT